MLNKIMDVFPDELFLKAEGYDDAVIGVDESSMRLIYSSKKIIEILSKDMSHIDAVDFYEYNILGGYVGEMTPIFSYDRF